MKLKIPLPNTLFRLGLLLMMVKTLISISLIVPYSGAADDILSVLAALCLTGSILQKRFAPKTLLGFSLMAALALLSTVQNGTLSLLLTVITCLAFYKEDFDKAIRFLLFWEGAYVAVHMVLSLFFQERAFTSVSGEMRYNFGFSHPNGFAVLLMNLTAMWCWLHYESLRPRHLCACVLSALFFYCFTGSRSMLLGVSALMALTAAEKRGGKWIKRAAAVCVPVVSAAEYYLWTHYTAGNRLVRLIDEILSTRVKLGAYALEHFGVSVFGQNLQSITVSWDEYWRLGSFTFDDIYSFLFVNFGLVWLIVAAVLFYRAARSRPAKYSVFIILWALYGMTETHVRNPYLFFPILLVSASMEDSHE